MRTERSDANASNRKAHRGRRSEAALLRRKQPRDEPTHKKRPLAKQRDSQGTYPSSGSCKAESTPLEFEAVDFTLVHCNLNGCTAKHMAELHAHLQLLDFPAFVALNETKLDSNTPDSQVRLENYTLVARRDRTETKEKKSRKKKVQAMGCGGGGVALFARNDCATSVVLLQNSATHERSWLTVHTSLGPLLLGVWYRPPGPETASVETLEEEWLKLSDGALGTVLVGDLNVHHLHWLTYSSTAVPTTPAGKSCTASALRTGLKNKWANRLGENTC